MCASVYCVSFYRKSSRSSCKWTDRAKVCGVPGFLNGERFGTEGSSEAQKSESEVVEEGQ